MNNSKKRKISVTLPDLLLEDIDTLASSLNRSRSEVIKVALIKYLQELKTINIKQLKKGDLEMGDINLSIAENSLLSDENACEIYEEFLRQDP